jgi:hypothetical protein
VAENGSAELPKAVDNGRRSVLLEIACVAVVVVAVAWLYRSSLAYWWAADDFFNVRWVRAFRAVDYCFDPAVWQQLPFRMLTPLLFVSYDVDLGLFGTQPRGFHVHQLVAVALAAVALYALLRLWLPRGWSLLPALLFVAGAPVASVAPAVMTRQYPEACLLGLLAALAWVLGLRARSAVMGWTLAVTSAALWLLASAAKEIAVPLVLVLPLLPEGSLALRLRRLVPHAMAVVVYALYRRHMLGTLVGGYGWAVDAGDWPRLAVSLPLKIGRELLGVGGVWGWLTLGLMLAAALALVLRGGRSAALLTAGALGALLPLLPVSTEVVTRYALAAWLVLVVAFPFAVRRLPKAPWIAALTLIVALVASRQAWAREDAHAVRMRGEYLALLDLRAGDVLRRPAVTPASLRELRAFAPEALGRDLAGGWFFDDSYLCARRGGVQRLFEYDETRRKVVDVTARLAELSSAACAAQARAAPLAATFHFSRGVLRWRLGPYEDGQWHLVFADGVESYAVPARGAFHMDAPHLVARIRYDAPAGWTTYSPPLGLQLDDGQRSSWSRR